MISDQSCATREAPHRHPGLVPGPDKKAAKAKDYNQSVIPGLPRDLGLLRELTKRSRFQNNPLLLFPRSRINAWAFSGTTDGDMRCAIPGRRIGLEFHPHRHPGLAPGPNEKATISKHPPRRRKKYQTQYLIMSFNNQHAHKKRTLYISTLWMC